MLDKTSIVVCGDDAECRAIRDRIVEDLTLNSRLASDVLDFLDPLAPVKGKGLDKIREEARKSGNVLLIAPRNPRLVEQMRALQPNLWVIDHVTLLDEPGYDYSGRPSCLDQFAALLGTSAPAGTSSQEAIAALARGGLPGLARTLWAQRHGQAGLPGTMPHAPLVTPPALLGAAGQIEAAAQWAKDKDARLKEPKWIAQYVALHAEVLAAFAKHSCCPTTALDAQFAYLGCGARRTAQDRRLVLVEVLAEPVAHASFDRLVAQAERAAFDWLWQEPRRIPATLDTDLVLLFVAPGRAEGAAPWAVTVLSGGGRRELLSEIAKPATRERWGIAALECRGMAAAERVSLSLRAASDSQSVALEGIVGRLLDELMIENRPLAAWRTNWLQFLRYGDAEAFAGLRDKLVDSNGPGRTVRATSPEERAYFIGHVRDTIAPELSERSCGDRGEVLISIGIQPAPVFQICQAHYDNPIVIQGEKLSVHFFHHECFAIEWSAEDADQGLGPNDPGRPQWWRSLLGPGQRVGLTLAELMDRNRHARFAYSPFLADPEQEMGTRAVIACDVRGKASGTTFYGFGFEQDEAGKPAKVDAPSGWLLALLSAVFQAAYGDTGKNKLQSAIGQSLLTLVEDERAHVVCSAVAAGGQPELAAIQTEFDALLHRLLTVEGAGTGFPCDAATARKELHEGLYGRFADWGSRFLVSDHSFVFLGFGDYAIREIHGKHMGKHMTGPYARMFLFSQLHAAILNAFASGLRQASERQDEWQEAMNLKGFTRFTSQIWCDQVTTQIEGTELFEHMRARSRADVQHAYLRREIEEGAERMQNQIVASLTVLGVLGALLLFPKSPYAQIAPVFVGQLRVQLQLMLALTFVLGIIWLTDGIVKCSVGRSFLGQIAVFRHFSIATNAGGKRDRVLRGGLIAFVLLFGPTPLIANAFEGPVRRDLPEFASWIFQPVPASTGPAKPAVAKPAQAHPLSLPPGGNRGAKQPSSSSQPSKGP